ncbi:EamA family transporter [Alteromonadales bacterium alter-6D02]|nr:EamA family transporter [Alteromonadales bacterium alter-6D02]
MSGTLVSFCLMAVSARELGDSIDTFQLLFYRSAIGLTIITLLIIGLGQLKQLKTQRITAHFIRNSFHLAGQYGWFVGISLLPLAQVFTLEFTVPLWSALLAWFWLNERLSLAKTISIMMGLIGVVVITQPNLDSDSNAVFIVLLSAIAYAFAHVLTKSLTRTESALTILFYMCLLQLPIAGAFAVTDWRQPSSSDWLWIIIISLTALSAHYCMSHALKCSDVATVMMIDFLRLPMIAVLGALLYGEGLTMSLLCGGVVMLLGNILSYVSFTRASTIRHKKSG